MVYVSVISPAAGGASYLTPNAASTEPVEPARYTLLS